MSKALATAFALLALPLAALAQTPAPAAAPPSATAKKPAAPAADEQPAVRVAPSDGPREDLRDRSGTTIVGERESPIGLYITPWRNAYAEQDIDRPARLLQVDMSPVDRDVFARQLEYYAALKDATGGKLKPPAATAPPAPPAAPSAAP